MAFWSIKETNAPTLPDYGKTVIFAQSWCNDFFQDTPKKHAMVKQKKLPNSVNMHIELSIKLGKLGLDNIAYNHSNILFLVFLRVSLSGQHLCSQNTYTVVTYRIFSVALAASSIIRQSEQWECLLFSIYCLAFELLPLVGCDTLSLVSITILVIDLTQLQKGL